MEYNDLTPEQKEKLVACKTPEEVLALAKDEGVDLTDEQIGAISGGIKPPFRTKGDPNSGTAIW